MLPHPQATSTDHGGGCLLNQPKIKIIDINKYSKAKKVFAISMGTFTTLWISWDEINPKKNIKLKEKLVY